MKRNGGDKREKPRKTIQFRSRDSIYEDKENRSVDDETSISNQVPQIRASQFLSKRHEAPSKNSRSLDSSSQDSSVDLKNYLQDSSEEQPEPTQKAKGLFLLADHVKANPEAGVQRVLRIPKVVYKEKEPKPKPLDPELPPEDVFQFQQENFYPKVRETKHKKKAVKKNRELKHIQRDVNKKGFGKFDPVQYGNFQDRAKFRNDNKTGLGPITKFLALDDYNIHNRKMFAWEEFEGPKKDRQCTDFFCIILFGTSSLVYIHCSLYVFA